MENVFSHLDTHEFNQGYGIEGTRSTYDLSVFYPFPRLTASSKLQYLGELGSKPQQPRKAMERLPQINYSLLNDNSLRKKLASLGLPNSGLRSLLVRRHTEWVNLVNANCDSNMPKTKRELLRELDTWDKSQGRQVINDSSTSKTSVMSKDFDGAAWAATHDGNFKNLIIDARRRAKSKQDEGNEDEKSAENNIDERSSNSSTTISRTGCPKSPTDHPPNTHIRTLIPKVPQSEAVDFIDLGGNS